MEKMTIYDVARLANVSPSTVSRVVNGNVNVKAETKARVLDVMRANHYVPDEAARGLTTQTTRLIGILLSDIRTTHHADGVYFIQRELSQIGYSCLIYNTGTSEAEQAAAIQRISQRNVDAAILMGSIYQNEAVLEAVGNYLAGKPVILCNGYLPGENLYGLISDEMEGVQRCVALLHARGKRCPVFMVNRFTPSNQLKREGYEAGMRACYPGAAPLVIETGDDEEAIHAATLSLLRDAPQADGILYAEDRMALVGLHALSQAGVAVPEHMAVVGINNSRLARYSVPSLTSLDNMLYDLSMTACRNLCALLKGEHVSRKMMLYSEIVERATT